MAAHLARSPELMIAFAISCAARLAAIGSYAGLSKELGGLLAGVSFTSTHFAREVAVLEARGADMVFLPFADAAVRAVDRLATDDGARLEPRGGRGGA